MNLYTIPIALNCGVEPHSACGGALRRAFQPAEEIIPPFVPV